MLSGHLNRLGRFILIDIEFLNKLKYMTVFFPIIFCHYKKGPEKKEC